MSIVADYPSVGSHRGLHRHHKHEVEKVPSQHFRVGYQKVTLDIDLAERTIYGETEITALPLESSLKEIKLDCRNIQIKSVIINQRRANFYYGDFSQNDEYMNDPENPVLADYKYNPYTETNSDNISISQHHLYRGKFYPLYSDQNNSDHPSAAQQRQTSELVIKIPDSINLRLQSNASRPTLSSPMGTTRSINGTPVTANSLMNSDRVYTPLNLKIIYTVKNSRNGIRFFGGRNTSIPRDRWFCYTFNNDLHTSASTWVPCIDNFNEKPAWDINIVVPKTIGDIGREKIIGTKEAEEALRQIQLEEMDEDDADVDADGESKVEEGGSKVDDGAKDEDTEKGENNEETTDKDPNAADNKSDESSDNGVDESRQIVVAVPDLVSFKETPHKVDMSKKVVNFQFYNPVSAHHLGFAVGPFEKVPLLEPSPSNGKLVPRKAFLASFADENEEPLDMSMEANSNKVPTMYYFLPGRREEVINSTLFMYKALNFYSKEFSSFPFTSYTVVFLEDFPSDVCTFAGMTIASDKLLYGPRLIEPSFKTTEILSSALAEQYSGVNVLPKSLNDIWCTTGLAGYMSLQFLKKLYGVNMFKYMIRQKSELLCRLDINKRPMSNQHFRFPINWHLDLEFLRLKAPLILYILNQRMVRTDRSFGLSRVIPKIFLQAMSNDSPHGNCLSTSHFQHVCEKVVHHKLDGFFENWVHNPGVPRFTISQKFNKKRMFIEMSIRQTQSSTKMKRLAAENDEELTLPEMRRYVQQFKNKYFIDEADQMISGEESFEPLPAFTGPITIRIHEADGTPYEHILYIREPYTKFDIQYNTKYRRTRRRKEGLLDDSEENKSSNSEGYLGDILMTSSEAAKWGLKEDATDESTNIAEMQSYAFEWMRFDADNEWICEKHLNVSDEMQESMLQQDRDVDAQMEAVQYFADIVRPKLHFANILLRTLLDTRYFYGVRIEAAHALARISSEDNDHIGMRYLLRAFKRCYCYNHKSASSYDEFDPKEYHPLPNDFSCYTDMLVMKSIVQSLSEVRNKDGDSPIELKKIILTIFRYNDNMDNEFDDCLFVCEMLRSLSLIIEHSKKFLPNHKVSVLDNVEATADIGLEISREAMMEINRAVKMDGLQPSYHNCITVTAFEEKLNLCRRGLIKLRFEELIKYTHPRNDMEIRLMAFRALLLLGGLRNTAVLRLLFVTLKLEKSEYLKESLGELFVESIGSEANEGTLVDAEPSHDNSQGINHDESQVGNSNSTMSSGLSIVQEESTNDIMESRKIQMARKTIDGRIEILRNDIADKSGLKDILWDAVHSCLLPIGIKRDLLDAIALLYPAENSFKIKTDLPADKKVVARWNEKDVEPNKKFPVTLKREGRLTIQIPSIQLKTTFTKPVLRVKTRHPEKTTPRLTLTTSNPKKLAVKMENQIPVKTQERKKVLVSRMDQSLKITLRFKPGTIIPGAPKRSKLHLIKQSSILPIRYIRFNLISKEIWASDVEDFGQKADNVAPVLKTESKIVTLKIPKAKLMSLSERQA